MDPLGAPPLQHPNRVKKKVKRGYNMLHIGYLIILDGQSIKKISFGKFHF